MAGAGAVFHNAEQGAKLVAANTKFALELYQRQSTATAGNIFVSPLSISIALSMTYAGARNQTKKQMADVVKLGEVEEQHLHEAFSDLRTSLNKPSQPYKLFMANRLFGEKSYSFLEEFLNLGRKYYGAELAPVDFACDSAGAAAIINKWVAENTNNMINDIVPASALNALTRLVLVNAIYFKGDWAKKFEKAHTKTEDFFVSPSETIKVDLMRMHKVKFSHGSNQDLNCQAIALPYSGDALSMFILLPDKTTTLSDVENKLTDHVLLDVESSFGMYERDVYIWLPRFRLDESLELSNMLKAMGMVDAFSSADFSGMDGGKDLYISKVLHRAVVEVNEEGTEAAAATAVVMMMRCAVIPQEPLEFRADHPFLFFIRDNATKSILFVGRVVKPLRVTVKDEL